MYFRPEKRGEPAKDTGDKRRKLLSLSALAACALILVLMCVFSTSCICYAVSYDGTVVGQVSSREELNAAIETADTLAGEILGEEHPIVQDLSVSVLVGSSPESADELADKLVESVDGIDWRCVVLVDGHAVGALESHEELPSMLDSILAHYTTDTTVSASIKEDVTYAYAFVSAELEVSTDEMVRLLDPENGESEYRLTVLTRETSQTVEPLPYNTEVTYDPEGYSDEISLMCEGQDGQLTCSYVLDLENGHVISRHLEDTQVSAEPVDEQITVGALPGSRTDSRGCYIWPTTGWVTSEFGGRETEVGNTDHMGIDIGSSVGTSVWAADGGEVIYADDTGAGYGLLVKILHDNGTVTCYAHLSRILVNVGDKVAQGDVIARMGCSGNVTGPHLHFEVRPDGVNAVNPRRYLSGWPATE